MLRKFPLNLPDQLFSIGRHIYAVIGEDDLKADGIFCKSLQARVRDPNLAGKGFEETGL